MSREQVGWVRFDGDEYFDFRYFTPEDRHGLVSIVDARYVPVYTDLTPDEKLDVTAPRPEPQEEMR